jgi:hypothetical protein
LSQAPQWVGSEARSVQEPSHAVSPIEQLATHCPAEQTWPELQALPQAPQFAGSFAVSMHVSAHFASGAHEAAHTPAAQTSPAPQALPQAPQFFGSWRGSTH